MKFKSKLYSQGNNAILFSEDRQEEYDSALVSNAQSITKLNENERAIESSDMLNDHMQIC